MTIGESCEVGSTGRISVVVDATLQSAVMLAPRKLETIVTSVQGGNCCLVRRKLAFGVLF